jgi:hypothetical protein
LTQAHFEKTVSAGRTGDRGKIESISSRELPVYWLSEMDGQRVKALDHPGGKLFVVDVSVEIVSGEPRTYRILNLVDILEK